MGKIAEMTWWAEFVMMKGSHVITLKVITIIPNLKISMSILVLFPLKSLHKDPISPAKNAKAK